MQAPAERFRPLRAGKTAASNADSSRWLWPECLVEAVAERFRPLRAGKRQPRTPIVAECFRGAFKVLGCFRPFRAGKRQPRTPIVADGCGLLEAATERFRPLRAGKTAASNADSSRWLWPACLVEAAAEGFRFLMAGKQQQMAVRLSGWSKLPVEAAAERFRPLRAGKRQPRTPIVADGYGLRAWSKLRRSVLGL